MHTTLFNVKPSTLPLLDTVGLGIRHSENFLWGAESVPNMFLGLFHRVDSISAIYFVIRLRDYRLWRSLFNFFRRFFSKICQRLWWPKCDSLVLLEVFHGCWVVSGHSVVPCDINDASWNGYVVKMSRPTRATPDFFFFAAKIFFFPTIEKSMFQNFSRKSAPLPT